MNHRDILHSPFSIEVHKENFKSYLEIVILENGVVEYAVPSHQEKLISLACSRLNVTRDELNDLCPPEYYGDFITWLNIVSHAIPVWNEFYMGKPNENQLKTLQLLQDEKLYLGRI